MSAAKFTEEEQALAMQLGESVVALLKSQTPRPAIAAEALVYALYLVTNGSVARMNAFLALLKTRTIAAEKIRKEEEKLS